MIKRRKYVKCALYFYYFRGQFKCADQDSLETENWKLVFVLEFLITIGNGTVDLYIFTCHLQVIRHGTIAYMLREQCLSSQFVHSNGIHVNKCFWLFYLNLKSTSLNESTQLWMIMVTKNKFLVNNKKMGLCLYIDRVQLSNLIIKTTSKQPSFLIW